MQRHGRREGASVSEAADTAGDEGWVRRTVEDLKESQVAGAGEQREEMVTWSWAGLSPFWPVGP